MWTKEDEEQAEAYADEVRARKHIHRCGGEVFYMGGRKYECTGCGSFWSKAPEGVTPRRWQVRAEND